MSKKQKMTAVVLSGEDRRRYLQYVAESRADRSRGSPGTVYLHVYE